MVGYVFMSIGIFSIILGMLLYNGKLNDSIAGYDSSKDNEVLAGKWVGSNIIIMGLLIILSSMVLLLINDVTPLIGFSMFMGSVIIFSLRITILYNKKVRKNI